MRFLCVHGMGTSANIFESQLAQIRANLPGQHDFVFIDGVVQCEPLYGIEAFFPGPYFCYYELPTPDQVQEAHDLISETIEEDGPFDGIIGFSQGGALASSYILSELRSPSRQSSFKCAIFLCASGPFDLLSRPFCINTDGTCRHADTSEPMPGFDVTKTIPETKGSNGWAGNPSADTPLLHRYTSPPQGAAATRITIPTTHIVGANDGYRGQGMQVRDLCVPRARYFVEHRGEHDIPTDRHTTTKMVGAIQSMLQDVLVG